MALARVRGCAKRIPPATAGPAWLADASRRGNGPRKGTFRRLITVRLRNKSCLAGGYRVPRDREKSSSGTEAANLSAGGCGVEDQVGRAGAHYRSLNRRGNDGHHLQGQAHQRPGTLPEARGREAGQAGEARPEGLPDRRPGVQGTQPTAV